MKTLTKHISVGKYEFDVTCNREITADCFEHFPELIEFLLRSSEDETEIILDAVKNKKLLDFLTTDDKIAEFVKYAFPKMLKGDENADEIIAYIYENDVEDDFNRAMFEIVSSGFIPETAEKKPKVKFEMN
ncbi:MAG: hypothetical protein J5662_01265 [Clostridia bacterium]|nr:hypothetical protein [Clostridia bacterium]